MQDSSIGKVWQTSAAGQRFRTSAGSLSRIKPVKAGSAFLHASSEMQVEEPCNGEAEH